MVSLSLLTPLPHLFLVRVVSHLLHMLPRYPVIMIVFVVRGVELY